MSDLTKSIEIIWLVGIQSTLENINQDEAYHFVHIYPCLLSQGRWIRKRPISWPYNILNLHVNLTTKINKLWWEKIRILDNTAGKSQKYHKEKNLNT